MAPDKFLNVKDIIASMKVIAVIPAYNEEKRIVKTLEELNDYLSRQSYPSTVSCAASVPPDARQKFANTT